MKKLSQDQNGIAHILIVIVFVVAFAGALGFAYTRISSNQQTAETSESTSDDTAAADDSEDQDSNQDPDQAADNQEANDDDPSAGIDEAI